MTRALTHYAAAALIGITIALMLDRIIAGLVAVWTGEIVP